MPNKDVFLCPTRGALDPPALWQFKALFGGEDVLQKFG